VLLHDARKPSASEQTASMHGMRWVGMREMLTEANHRGHRDGLEGPGRLRNLDVLA